MPNTFLRRITSSPPIRLFSAQAYELLPTDSPPARSRRGSFSGGQHASRTPTLKLSARYKGKGRLLAIAILVGASLVLVLVQSRGALSELVLPGQESGGSLDSVDPLTASFPQSTLPDIALNPYHLPIFRPPSPLPHPSVEILPYPSPSLACLEHLYTLSPSSLISPLLCPPSTSLSPLDIVITFVNGSSPSFHSAYASTADYINAQPPASIRQKGANVMSKKPRHYAEMNEMKYAVRSTRLLGGKRGEAGVVRAVTMDFSPEAWEDGGLTDLAKKRLTEEGWRVGQVPDWLDRRVVEKEGNREGQDPNSGGEEVEPVEEDIDALSARSSNPKPIHEPIKPYAISPSSPKTSLSSANPSKSLSFHFHSEIFLPPNAAIAQSDYLPTFNSFSIESQLHNIPNLSPNFVSMNDDFFLLRATSASDFHSETFGPVLRFQNDLQVRPREDIWAGDPGEWAALGWAAHTLGKRLPSSHLEYLSHIPKTLSAPHLHELHLTFPEALSAASKRRFREQKIGGPDIEIAFLLAHYIRQKHREALLWSYVVARPAPSSVWARPQREELEALGVDGWEGKIGKIRKPKPASLAAGSEGGAKSKRSMGHIGQGGAWKAKEDEEEDDGEVRWKGDRIQEGLREVGEEEMMVSEVQFSSLTGIPRQNFQIRRDRPLSLQDCLGGDWWNATNRDAEVDSEWLFRRLAFEKVECGDRLLTAILSLTTEPGLTSLLPHPNSTFPLSVTSSSLRTASTPPSIYKTPHLPLTPTHETASFSLSSLFTPISISPSSPLTTSPCIILSTATTASNPTTTATLQLLPFTLSLLSRYRHTLGATPVHFTSLRGPISFKAFNKTLTKLPDTAFLCLNDDLPVFVDRAKVASLVQEFGEERWPEKGDWEL